MTGRGKSKRSLDLIEAMRGILERVQPTTVRGVCYQLFIAGHIESMHGKHITPVYKQLKIAREEGIIDWRWIVDETRGTERAATWDGLGDFGETIVRGYRKDFWQHQDAWLKVISEKATIGGVVRPVLREFAVDFQVMHGYGSATALNDIAEESRSGDPCSKFSTSVTGTQAACTCPRWTFQRASSAMAAT